MNQEHTAQSTLIRAQGIYKRFDLPGGHSAFSVLENISMSINKGEIVALLGRSGSGKSTLLRILAGLIFPSEGQVLSGEKPVIGPNPDVAIVFQSFALLPWLTVQQNVELGLEAVGMPKSERRSRALKAIDMVGLDGFENAYPKELSGGMKQRVGFARAFVKQPQVMFFDEPFSALDVLTAENLRHEISSLWEEKRFPAHSLLIVSHNIEEVVTLADRVLILGSNPGHIRCQILIDLPRPRDHNEKHFQELVQRIYVLMTNPDLTIQDVTPPGPQTAELQFPAHPKIAELRFPPLPHARAGGISGLLELVQERGCTADLAELAGSLRLKVNELLIIVDAAVMLGFAELTEGVMYLTDVGIAFADADILQSKEIFRTQVLHHVPLIQTVVQTLNTRKSGAMRAVFFEDVLDEYYPEAEAQRQLETAIDWGRYAELFEYDASGGWITTPQ